jgi:O-antigen/teichoic acid export membrane protein
LGTTPRQDALAATLPAAPAPDAAEAPDAPATGTAMSQRAARNTVALIVGRVVGMALTGASSIPLTRCLGDSEYGQYASIQAYVVLFAWAATFGVDAILPREIARRPELARKLIRSASLISAGASALTMAIALALSPAFHFAGLMLPLLLGAVDGIGLAPLRIPAAAYQADLRQWVAVAASTARQIVWVGLLFVLWRAGASLQAVLVCRLAASLVEIAIIVYGLRARLRQSAGAVPAAPGLTPALLAASVPVALTGLAACISHRFDQVLLHRSVQPAAVGHYAAATNLVELFNILPGAVMASLFPLLVRSAHAPGELNRQVVGPLRYLLVCGFAVCLLTSLAGTQIITLLSGRSFAPAGPLAAILGWSELASFLNVVLTNVVLAASLQRFLPVATGIGAAVNLGLNLALIPRYGPAGAAWATVVSYSAVALTLLLAPRQARALVFPTGKVVLALGALTAAALAAAKLVGGPFALRLAAAALVYIGGVFATRTVRLGELRAIIVLVMSRKRGTTA